MAALGSQSTGPVPLKGIAGIRVLAQSHEQQALVSHRVFIQVSVNTDDSIVGADEDVSKTVFLANRRQDVNGSSLPYYLTSRSSTDLQMRVSTI